MTEDDTNLLEETLECLKENRIKTDMIKFCMTDDGWFTWDEFVEIARDANYDNSYGLWEIDKSLKIVGEDFYLERHEYDGSEWWEFKKVPQKPNEHAEKIKLLSNWKI